MRPPSLLITACAITYSLRPKKSDAFDFQTSCLTVYLIQKIYVNYKINKSLVSIYNDKIILNKIYNIYVKNLNKTNS